MFSVITMICFVADFYSPPIITVSDLYPVATFSGRNEYLLDTIRRPNKSHIVRLVGIWLPLSAITAFHALFHISPFDKDTTVFRQRQGTTDIFSV